jgi:hypothetical protein
MPQNPSTDPNAETDRPMKEDQPVPAASEDKVLDDTARLAREGRKELERDPKEPKPAE